ncbi:hypothetical protein [Cohnella sp. 56]|uniref:hypothetical protein n=1 Tax=Cohnella sp. 56 TaxID=3113722 RepID=UPI0030E9661E
MNARDIVRELPKSAQAWLAESPWTRDWLTEERHLSDVLADPDRAARWAVGAPPLARDALALIVKRFGCSAFAEDKLAPEGGRPGIGWTGAELRLAVQLLRRDGILFAMSRPWGDRLLLLPEDMYPVWRSLLLPLRVDPLPAHVWMEGCDAAAAPLSHELICAWAAIRRTGLPLKASGDPRKREAAGVAGAMRLQPEEIPYTAALPAWEGVPPTAALAVRLGLSAGMLRQAADAIVAEPNDAAKRWLQMPAAAAERYLLELAIRCLLPEDRPGVRLAAESLRDLAPMRWYREQDIIAQMPTREAAEATGGWIRFLRAAGWAETGSDADGAALRWTMAPAASEPGETGTIADGGRYELMPDLEAIVPPEVPPGVRWELELVARRLSEDVVAVYRLDPDYCRRSRTLGLALGQAEAILERGTGASVPAAAGVALRDWWGMDRPPAERGAWTAAGAGDPPPASAAADRPAGGGDGSPARLARGRSPDARRVPAASASERYVWDSHPPLLSLGLYPGADGIPPGWLRQPALYHASTRRELVERAIGWRAALRLNRSGEWIDLIPERLLTGGEQWRVEGRSFVREAASGRPICAAGTIALGAEEIGETMILLPGAAPASSERPIS